MIAVLDQINQQIENLRLDRDDAKFLAGALGRLPGAEAVDAPVTIEANGRVCVRARDEGQERVTELVLNRSRYTGEPVRLATNRGYLAWALRLGLTEFAVAGPEQPVAVRVDCLTLGWQPLAGEAEESHHEIGHPLLAAWGRQPQQHLNLVAAVCGEEGVEQDEHYEDPAGDSLLTLLQRSVLDLDDRSAVLTEPQEALL